MQKTPNKLEENIGVDNKKTPEKLSDSATAGHKNGSTPLKETGKLKSFEFTTPKKSAKNSTLIHGSPESQIIDNKTPEKNISQNKTPEKKENSLHLKSEQIISCDEDEMISTTEQARLLIAASKTPSKSGDKTPAKQNTSDGKRSAENSPVTPGKFRRVELITLASPKAKRIKQL